MPASLQGLLLSCVLLLRWKQSIVKFSFHRKSEIHLLLPVNKLQVKTVSSTYRPKFIFFRARENLAVTSTISSQWLLWCCDLPVANLLKMCRFECVITLGLWENKLHKAEGFCQGQGRKEESWWREQLTWEVMPWRCLFFDKDLMCGRERYLGASGWDRAQRLTGGYWNSECPEGW